MKNKIKVIAGLFIAATAMSLSSVSVAAAPQENSAAEISSDKNGWVKEKGSWYFYKDGKFYTGWHKMGAAEKEKKEHWSYFGKDGKLYTGWHYMTKAEDEKTPHWSYFGDNGWLRTGWVQLGKGTKEPDGNKAKHWSYFGDNGWLRTGWVQLGKGTNNPDGNAAKHWSYFGDNGWLRTGWVQLGKGTKEPDGNKAKHWSYFGNNGWLRTGWVQLGKGTNNPDGNNAKHWSYFGTNGWLTTNWKYFTKADGEKTPHWSYFGANGWLYTGWYTDKNGLHYFDNKGWMKQNTTALINGKYYSFNNIGVVGDTNINWNPSWQYAGYSKIHSSSVKLYRSNKTNRKGVTVAVNAGHGTRGGSSVKTQCHPDGSAKVTGGSTSAGSVWATAISEGTTLLDGTSEANANLELAKVLKQRLLDAGYDVLMIRETNDTQLDNIARTVFANNYANYHISLHYDSTASDKGFFYTSVPNIASYRAMQPVASNWRKHEALGQALLNGARKNGLKIYGSGKMALDLTQTSYSTIASVDVEVGDRASSHSKARLELISKAIVDGLNQLNK